jgi:hypothetical protein
MDYILTYLYTLRTVLLIGGFVFVVDADAVVDGGTRWLEWVEFVGTGCGSLIDRQ